MTKRSSFQDSTREILISEVQTRPCLWNDEHPQYKDSEKNKKIWEEIGKVIEMTGNDAKSKWKNLKDKFRRELQKEPKGRSGDAGGEYKSKWPFFNMMMFVKDSLIPSVMSGNLIVGEQLQNTQVTDNESDIDVMSSSFVEDLSPSTSTTFSQSTFPKSTKGNKKKRFVDDSTQKLLDLEEKKIAILQNAQEREKKTYDDPDAQFLLSFLPYIQQLSSLEKLEVRSQIQSVVLNAYRKKSQGCTPLVQQLHETDLQNSRKEFIQTQIGPSNESQVTQIYRPYNEDLSITSAAPSISEPTNFFSLYSSIPQSNHGSTKTIPQSTFTGTPGTQRSDISLGTNTQYSHDLFNLDPY